MLWAFFPIVAQIFYTSGSYIQNYVTDTAFPKNRAGALIIAYIPRFLVSMLLMFAIFGRLVFVLPLGSALGFVLAGAINVISATFFYKALQAGDAADVLIFNQLSPLISLALGVTILGETISVTQGLGFLFIMAAVAIVVFGGMRKNERSNPNLKVIAITITAAFFSVLSDVVYAFFAREYTADLNLFAKSFFFFELGSALGATIFFICMPHWRKALKTVFIKSKNHNRNILAVTCDSLLHILAELLYKYGLLIVPIVAMMTAVGKVSNLFVSFFFTVFIGKIFPKFVHSKRITKRVIVRYIVAGILIVSGILIMN